MSAVAGHQAGAASGWSEGQNPGTTIGPRAEPWARATGCVIRWSLSRAALTAASDARTSDRPFVIAPHGEDPTLEWVVAPTHACAFLVDGTARFPIVEAAAAEVRSGTGQVEVTTIDHLVHVRVVRRGVCVLTVVLRRGETRPVLYARTSVLAELGIGGGRYEVLDGRVIDA